MQAQALHIIMITLIIGFQTIDDLSLIFYTPNLKQFDYLWNLFKEYFLALFICELKLIFSNYGCYCFQHLSRFYLSNLVQHRMCTMFMNISMPYTFIHVICTEYHQHVHRIRNIPWLHFSRVNAKQVFYCFPWIRNYTVKENCISNLYIPGKTLDDCR